MIDSSRFLTPYDVISVLGGQGFDPSVLLSIIQTVTDDAERESSAFSILDRRKQLNQLMAVLNDCLSNERICLTPEQLHSLASVNSAVVSFMISGIKNHMQDFQSFVLYIVKNKLYDFEKLKYDVQAILSNDSSQFTQFDQLVLFNCVQSSMTVNDVLPLFSQVPEMFSMIYKDKAHDLIAEVNAELMSIELDDVIKIIFESTKKRALSAFIKDRNVSAALDIYTESFDKLLGYGTFDIDTYLDKACDSLVDLEEVIS